MTPALTVFYNGACPICAREIHHYQKIATTRQLPLAFEDISGDEGYCPLNQQDMLMRLHVKDSNGAFYKGVDAFIRLWRELPYYTILSRIAALPLLKPGLIALYDRILAPWLFKSHLRRQARASN